MTLSRQAIIEDIVHYYRSCFTPEKKRRIGAEFEKIAVDSSGNRIGYDNERGIREFLTLLSRDYGEVTEKKGENILGLRTIDGSITLEPGAQLELGTRPWDNLHQIAAEWYGHLHKILEVGEKLGYRWLAIGIDPFHCAEDVKIIPKDRYHIMNDYLPQHGKLAKSMMRLTAAIQVNLDYMDEQDAISMLRTGLAVSPLITAMFANSPLTESRTNGYLSYRTYVWDNTDAARCGLMLPVLQKQEFSFADYAELLLDLPLMFRYDRHKNFVPAHGATLLQWMATQKKRRPEISEIQIAIQQLFTEVRLKSFIEFRGIDCPPPALTMAAPALWVGLMYDQDVRSEAWELCRHIGLEERKNLWLAVARKGLQATIFGKPIQEQALKILELAERGLQKRACYNHQGDNESVYLQPLKAMVQQGITPAELLLQSWDGDIGKLLDNISYKKL